MRYQDYENRIYIASQQEKKLRQKRKEFAKVKKWECLNPFYFPNGTLKNVNLLFNKIAKMGNNISVVLANGDPKIKLLCDSDGNYSFTVETVGYSYRRVYKCNEEDLQQKFVELLVEYSE